MKPGRSFFIAAVIMCFLSMLSYFEPVFLKILIYGAAFFLLILIADGIILFFFTDRLKIERKINSILALGHSSVVELVISSSGRGITPGKIILFDIYDNLFDCTMFPAQIKPFFDGGKYIFRYEITAMERGDWRFPACELLLSSPFRFWAFKIRHEVVSQGFIYPDFNMIYSSVDFQALVSAVGETNARKRGMGLEFDSLREWQSGDSVRAVDWRATGRKGKLIIREYRDQQDQQILFILDSGFRLHKQEENFSEKKIAQTQFDSALNAVLLLAHVALKHGDSVAVSVFGSVERWVSPVRGVRAFAFLMNSLYNVRSASCPSSVFSAIENALSRLKRRTFIIVVSNFREEDENQLSGILNYAEKKHLLLLANIREPQAENLAKMVFNDDSKRCEDDILLSSSAFAYIAARQKLMKKWENRGILTLESTAGTLSPRLINSYLKVKHSGAL